MAQFYSFSKFFSFILILFVSFLPFAFPHSLSSLPHSFQILNITSSIQNTLQILSPKSQSLHQESIKQPHHFSSSSSLSVSLHPRTSLIKSQHKNYTSLTLTRLARDITRVSSLTKLHHSGIKTQEFQTPLTSGISQGSGEYFARIGVGQPVKQFYMAIDTGSNINWLQCEPCSQCYKQTDPIFKPSDSSTYNRVSCDSTECSALRTSCSNNTCIYEVHYGDGSYTAGEFATETVTLGEGSFPNVAIGCGHENIGLFTGSAGLLGLGVGSLSLPSQIKATLFSYCLVDRDSDSSSTLDFNSVGPTDSIVAPLLRNSEWSTFFFIDVVGISVAGEMLPLLDDYFVVDEEDGDGGTIMDSGTTITRLRTPIYYALRDTFIQYAQNYLPSAAEGFSLFDTCFDLSKMKTATVPTIAFHFSSDKMLSLSPKNVLVPVDSSGKFCLAFAPVARSFSIIGNVQQQGIRVSYDLANNLVGFSPDKC